MYPKLAVWSKTIWLNVLVTAAAVFELIAQQEWVAANPAAVGVIVAIIGILNVALRFFTTQPITVDPNEVKFGRLVLVPLLAFAGISAASVGYCDDRGLLPDRPDISIEVDADEQDQVIETADEKFHRSVLQAASQLVKDGKLKRVELIRLRVAMLSPAFRERAKELAIVQMSASGSDAVGGEHVPVDEDGKIVETAINWEGLANFMKVFIPLLLELLKAFG